MEDLTASEFHNYHPSLFENSELRVAKTAIPGMLIVDLVLHGDERGWFKESYQREKLEKLGFPEDFNPVQNNVSSNREVGVTRGIHAEPWNKFITLTRGLCHISIVDLRKGPTFGTVEQLTMTPARAMYIPKGCGNSYQTLTTDVEYSYLVDAHWSPNAQYTFVNLTDPELNIDWPIPIQNAIISDKDRDHPLLKDVTPMEF